MNAMSSNEDQSTQQEGVAEFTPRNEWELRRGRDLLIAKWQIFGWGAALGLAYCLLRTPDVDIARWVADVPIEGFCVIGVILGFFGNPTSREIAALTR